MTRRSTKAPAPALAAGVEREHALLSPSGAYRWMRCPGQPNFTKHIKSVSSSWAAEGTLAHQVHEAALKAPADPSMYIGEIYEVEVMGKMTPMVVTREMTEAVAVSTSYLRDLRIEHPDAVMLVEQRVSLDSLRPASPIHGTSDVVIYLPSIRVLIPYDYKHGQGVLVDVMDNEQLLIYALGTWVDIAQKRRWKIDEIRPHIAQPRANHPDGPIRHTKVSPLDLMDFAQDVLAAAAATQEPDAPLIPGEHCKWCPAEQTCTARLSGVASALPAPGLLPELPAGGMLTAAQRGELLQRIDQAGVEDWIAALRASVFADLSSGQQHKHWKLVPKRASRVWSEPAQKVIKVFRELGVEERYLWTDPELISPAAAERLVGKKRFPKDIAVSVSSGNTLVPASDPRAAVQIQDAADEFDDITP